MGGVTTYAAQLLQLSLLKKANTPYMRSSVSETPLKQSKINIIQ
jgi:hypothetical protein